MDHPTSTTLNELRVASAAWKLCLWQGRLEVAFAGVSRISVHLFQSFYAGGRKNNDIPRNIVFLGRP
jgi:hypothetical protein